jgi:hypothetical protein
VTIWAGFLTLGGCIVAGRLSGEVRLNGQPVQKQSYFRRISGYVMQDNLMLDTLTVTHCLLPFLFHSPTPDSFCRYSGEGDAVVRGATEAAQPHDIGAEGAPRGRGA